MGRTKQCLGVLALAGLAAASIGVGSASAATKPVTTKAEWQAAIAQVAAPGKGCYHASYPVLQWHAVKCAVAPRRPLVPAPPSRSALRGRPMTVGAGNDYSAQVSGLISKATGSFHQVSSTITEKGPLNPGGPKYANAFSLQLNTQFFTGSPACSGSSDPANCQAWQQFAYTWNNPTSGIIFMQYWLINYNATCPSGWIAYSPDCYTNSPAAQLPGGAIKARQLGKTKLTGSAASGGNDAVSLTIGTGAATLVSNSDSVVDLAQFWNTTEWNVFGDGSGSEAFFNANASMEPQTVLKATSSAAPTCVNEGFTAETNNLTLTTTPALGTKTSPTMAFEQTDGTTGTPSCAVAG